MGDIRVGKVSSIDYENGMVRILYTCLLYTSDSADDRRLVFISVVAVSL